MSKKRSDDECRSIAQDKDKMRDNPTGCKGYNAKALKEILEECIPGYQYQNKDIACDEFLGNFGSKAKKTKAVVTSTPTPSTVDISTATVQEMDSSKFTISTLKAQFKTLRPKITIPSKFNKAQIARFIYDKLREEEPSPVQTPISTPKVSQVIPTPKPTPSVSEVSDTSESESYTKDELEKMLKPDLNKIAKGMGISFLKRTKENIINDILDKQKPMESVEVAEEVIFPVKNEVWEYAEKISKIDKEQFEDMGNEINKVSDVFDEVNESMADYITKKYPNEFEDILNFYENHENVIDEMRIRELRDYIRLEHPDSYAKLYGEVPEETVSELIPEIVPEIIEEPVKEKEEEKVSKEMKKIEKLRQKLIDEGIIMENYILESDIDMEKIIKNECDEDNPCPDEKSCFVKNSGDGGYCIEDMGDINLPAISDVDIENINGNNFVGSRRALDILKKRYGEKSKKPEVKETPIQAPVQIEEDVSEEEEPVERLTTEDIEDVLEKMTTKDTHDELRKSIAKCIGLL